MELADRPREWTIATQADIYANVHFLAATVALTAAYFAWRRRAAPGGVWLCMVMLAASVWTFVDGMDLSAVGLERHVFWAKMSYLGAGTVSVFLLFFALEYTDQGDRIRRRTAIGLLSVPLAAFVITLFNDYHGLTWTGFIESPTDPNVVIYQHGPLFWLLTLYSFVLLLVTTAIIIGFARRAPRVYRNQSLAIIGAILIPWAAMIVYIAAPGRFPGFNPSIGVVASGLVFTFGILRNRLLDLVPIARETLVETMSDGLLAIDRSHRVVDINPAAIRLLGLPAGDHAGQKLDHLLEHWPELSNRIGSASPEGTDFMLPARDDRFVNFEILPLHDTGGVRQGELVVIRDVSAQVQAERALVAANEELQARVAEIEHLHSELSEQAIRDPLTGLLNRRYLTEMLTREIGRAAREGYPVSFIMLDIDGFKRINDQHGHATGDLILRMLGSQLLSQIRAGDIACRYGGDEFLLVLTNTPIDAALGRAEHCRSTFEHSSIRVMGLEDGVSMSVGVATYPTHGESVEQVFAAADAAMYAAKAAGRNRVTVGSV